MAEADLQAFMTARTLYGSITRCRMYHEQRQDFVVLDLYTNVITANLVFASLCRPIDSKKDSLLFLP